MRLSIVIVNWNTKDLLSQCLRTIRDSGLTDPYEIIVVDNGSHDGSSQHLRTLFPEVSLIFNRKHHRRSAAFLLWLARLPFYLNRFLFYTLRRQRDKRQQAGKAIAWLIQHGVKYC